MNKNKKIYIIVIILIFLILFGINILFKKEEKINNFDEKVIFENNISIENEKQEIIDKIKVHIIGEVNNPGLIELKIGDRIADAIELANGLTAQADTSKTNLAHILSDGEKIYIPSINDEITENIESNDSNSKININTANISELEKIPGVGQATATAIYDYRNKNGRFMNIEDIKNVSGIGESKFEKMKEYITIK